MHADGDFPAKTLDYDTPPITERFTQPQYLDHSQQLIELLRRYSPAQISELMHLSDKLAALNVARYGSWTPAFTPSNAKQALLAFKGDVYTGLNADDFTEDDLLFAQKHLRMLSDSMACCGRWTSCSPIAWRWAPS